MSGRGIIFSAPMVRALLAGRKTQTRRLLNPQPDPRTTECSVCASSIPAKWMGLGPSAAGGTSQWGRWRKLPHSPGDRLYVREAAQEVGDGYLVIYRADYPDCVPDHFENVPTMEELKTPWRPSIHMFRKWSRMTLLVREVRVQRLQQISEADAKAEGVAPASEPNEFKWQHYAPHGVAFAALWDNLHIKPGERWADNPWIYALTFEVVRENIDRLATP